jgi:thiol:disulfide interchange protein
MATVKVGRSALILAAALVLGVATGTRAHDWNDAEVAWKDYEAALAAAKNEKKPICLVVYTEWCPHCANYSHVFHDPKVVEKSKELVMVRVDKDKNAELSKRYAPDGEYIPRTFFLKPDGKLDPDIHAPRDKYVYFYDEKDPASVLAGMDKAVKALK